MASFTQTFALLAWVLAAVISTSFALSDPPTSADCTDATPFADPDNCTCYYQCFMIDTGWYLMPLACPAGGIWDDVNKACIEGTCEVLTTTTEPTTTAPTTPTTTVSPTTPSTPTTVGPSDSTPSTASTAPTTSGPSSGSTQPASEPTTATSATSATPTTLTPVTSAPPTSGPPTFECTAVGFFPHPTDPTKYYQCVLIGAQFYYYIYACPPNACFQASAGVCVIGACPGDSNVTTTTSQSPVTTIATTTTSPVEIICNSQGSYPFPGSCTKYYKCILIQDSFVYYVFECPPNSFFNPSTSLCTNGPCPSTLTTVVATTTVATTPTTTPTTTLSTTTSAAEPSHPCPSEGYFGDPDDCQSYYRCILINGYMYRYMYRCPTGAYWNGNLQGCIVGTCPSGKSLPQSSKRLLLVDTRVGDPESIKTALSFPKVADPVTCTKEGFIPHPTNCTMYYQCVLRNGQFYSYPYTCPPFSKFDAMSTNCVIGVC